MVEEEAAVAILKDVVASQSRDACAHVKAVGEGEGEGEGGCDVMW